MLALLLLVSHPVAAGEPRFNRDIRPLLSDRCFHCHGPDEAERGAGLRLDRPDGDAGAFRSEGGVRPIAPGDPGQSEVWARITSDDPDLVMPPADSHKKPLTEQERELVRRWIASGAEYEEFWAFVAPRRPTPPTDQAGTPIDRFVNRRLAAESAAPTPEADKRTLVRRLTLDLTGLPPTLAEVASFLEDDSPEAYERLVDRLLASPRYGEHMARYWLDLVRFADTNGMHHDHYRNLWPYRDWVIRSFNDNLPYDEFTRMQIAGDLYPSPSRDQLIASGFNRLHLIIDVGTALPEESYTKNVIDRVTAVGVAYLGLTVQCAVCHDHKYDPITARDFYSLFAFFNNIDAAPETGKRAGNDFARGLQAPYINLTTPEQDQRLAELEARVERLGQAASDDAPPADRDALRQAQLDRDQFLRSLPAAMVMKERAEPRPSYVLLRGVYDNYGEQVQRGVPEFLPPLRHEGEQPSRMDLANWLVSREHPLTARVAVNRFWQQFFGVGIVKTSEDFGAQGEWPSHPDLLDYLAARFIDSGWDVKAIVKEMVMSAAYRRSSGGSERSFAADPENRLLARGARFRMDAEVLRDQILATSSLLNPRMYGESVRPPQPDGLWGAVTMPDSNPRYYRADEGDDIYRRSVYTFWKRGMPPPQMTIFNAPSRESCTARRERTNTPLQALLLMNEPEYLRAARRLARRAIEAVGESPDARVDRIYEVVTSQLPGPAQRETLARLARDLQAYYAANAGLADALIEGQPGPAGATPAEWAAWTMVASTVYNLDITKTHQ